MANVANLQACLSKGFHILLQGSLWFEFCILQDEIHPVDMIELHAF